MNDDSTDLEVFQQCRDLVFGDWTSAAIFVPLQVWIGEKLSPPCKLPPNRCATSSTRRWP